MGEILPNGEIQGYTGICQKCKKGISVNIQGDELGKHKCGINVLSLFDGMSCGQLALNRTNIKYNKYYASEIDKYTQIVSKANYPNTVYLGDVRNINVSELDPIDLLIGGSPCQSFSFAGKRKGMATKDNIEILNLEAYLSLKEQGFEFEGQSYLFWEYMRILTEIQKYNPDVNFLLENVMMGSKWQKILTRAIGINPIEINSALVSAQNRERLYWTNINSGPEGFFGDDVCKIPKPKDKFIFIKHILEDNVHPKYFLSEKALNGVIRSAKDDPEKHFFGGGDKSPTIDTRVGAVTHFSPYIKCSGAVNDNGELKGVDKSTCIDANYHKGMDNHSPLTMVIQDADIIIHNMMPRSSKTGKGGSGQMTTTKGKAYCLDTGNTNAIEIKPTQLGKSKNWGNCENDGNKAYCHQANKTHGVNLNGRIRRFTPMECERLQTVPDNYTNHVSDTQRYKMIGNGWTIDVITHIFSFLNC